MPYIERTVIAGDTIEKKKYFTAQYGGKRCKRAKREEETSEKQRRENEKNALDRLRWLINTNFVAGDFHIVLTYKGAAPIPEEAAKLLSAYLRKLRNEYRKIGIELKYIAVTEYEANRIHHHVIINKADTELISSLWKHGRVRFTPLDNMGDYSALASYLIKETKRTYKDGKASGKRWNASRNLKQPEIIKRVINADGWRKVPKPIKGYYIISDSIISDIDVFGYPYQKYTMIKIQQSRKSRTQAKPNYNKSRELNTFRTD